jgi:Tfp pilus assembly protein PilN
MIKINLIAERKPAKQRAASSIKIEGVNSASNLLLVLILLVGVGAAGAWWWMIGSELDDRQQKMAAAEAELKRLEAVIAKGEEYEAQKALLARKIELIGNLKRQQAIPVHILDQVSRNLPDFLWLDAMSAADNKISISGKATTYTAVSNFYSNLQDSGYFNDISLGRTFEVPEGVAFSLTCAFATATITAGEDS